MNAVAGCFDQDAFNQFILANGVIGFFDQPVTLKSGRVSNWYCNWRVVAQDAFLLDQLSDFLISFVADLRRAGKLAAAPDCIYGVPEGASKLGILAQYKMAKASPNFAAGSHVLAMGRSHPKPHGAAQDKFFIGVPRGKVLVVEDTTTTGGSLLTTLDRLIETGIEVIAAVGLTHRMERRDDGRTVAQAVAEKKSCGEPIPYFQMSSALQLLPEAARGLKPPADLMQRIVAEFSAIGEAPLQLR